MPKRVSSGSDYVFRIRRAMLVKWSYEFYQFQTCHRRSGPWNQTLFER